ncbi:MAG TPA: helix-turn-helix transcriptional regulator [Candidatus Dormibacteraeota bacterium]|jgi:transcriptional regulator with XRE-family HTH domain|nr:helix-turn-helix transcriptional regulator [Candidatus Dormibacteraeota bacterium]
MARSGRRGPGIDVIPERVRAARREAGLSLAQLAGGVVTPVAIHLIETGKSRPSFATLAHIANRTGKPFAYFTDQEPELLSTPALTSAARATRRMQEASWALSLMLRHPGLSTTERAALEAVLVGLRRSVILVRTILAELERR